MRPTPLKLELFLRGIKQIDIAKKANVDPAYINRCVNGKQKPSERIAEAIRGLAGEDVIKED